MGEAVQFDHERADGIGVEIFKISRPAIFISQAPEDDGGMIKVLVNHRSQHVAALPLVTRTAQAAATPRNLLPYEQAQFIAQLQYLRRLLVVAEAH